MSHQPWHYFLSVEKDFIRTIDFVELDEANSKTFSNEYAKLLLLIGSEVDVVAKMLCTKVAPDKKPANFVDYSDILTSSFKGFHTVEIDIPKYSRTVQPWLSWEKAATRWWPNAPKWWRAYNNVKHERDKNFPDANQDYTLAALCGWLALLLYFYKDEPHLQPYPDLLNHGFPEYIVAGGGKKLPGT